MLHPGLQKLKQYLDSLGELSQYSYNVPITFSPDDLLAMRDAIQWHDELFDVGIECILAIRAKNKPVPQATPNY